MQRPIRFRQTLLFVPGGELRKIQKAAQVYTDSVILDLEDATAPSVKAEARRTTADALARLDFGATERLVRINPVGSGLERDDIALVSRARPPDGLVVPKVESADDIRAISTLLDEAEASNGLTRGSIRLLALIETARGVVELADIATADARLDALIFGAEDLCGDIGALRSKAGWEVFYARSAVVLHAAARGLQAIDTPFMDFQDVEGLKADTRRALELGYTGKLAIHPKQLPVIDAVYAPSPEEVEQARRVIQAFDEQQAAGRGVFALDGKMVDMPMVRAARRVLARAERHQ
jgi:citrate lyase beta subunit